MFRVVPRLFACALITALALAAAPALGDDAGGAHSPTSAVVSPDQARLRMLAALHFAQVAREREGETAKQTRPYDCCEDLEQAKQLAVEKHLPLLVWVGGCDVPARMALDKSGLQAVHCHAKDWLGNASPRLVIPLSDRESTELPRGEITPGTVQTRLQMRHQAQALPAIGPYNTVPRSTQYIRTCSGTCGG